METESQTIFAQSIQPVNAPRVSVLIAAYRSNVLLAQAVNSVLIQDWDNLELIVCDDGTPDFDFSIIESQLRENTGHKCSWRILHQTRNIGTVRNLNAGLRLCSGKWALLLAADDALAAPDTITKLMHTAAESRSAWVIGRTKLCDDALTPTHLVLPTETELSWLTERNCFMEHICLQCFLPSSGNLYSMPLLKSFGLLDERYRLVEDWPLFLKIAQTGLLPRVSGNVSVLRRAGGLSHRGDKSNQVYQTDLITIIKQEIIPCLQGLDMVTQQRIRQHCQDKLDIYTLRFECTDQWSKLRWLMTHPMLLLRKSKERLKKKYDSL